MGLPLREALRQLCLDCGWSYAVSWKATVFQNRMHLIWEDGYYNQKALGIKSYFSELGCEADDPIKVLVDKIMASQVHFVGDGLVGQAASSGKYVWINKHRFGSIYKGLAELNCQFAAGIQTIIIIPVLPYGVIQLGSTQMVPENMGFIHHIRSLLTKITYNSNDLLSESTQKSLTEECQTYTSCWSTFGSRSTNACLNVDDRPNVTSDWCNPESLKPLTLRSLSEYVSLVSSQFNKKVQPHASQLVPRKQAVKMAYPIDKLILQSAEGIFHKPDIQCTQQVLLDDTNSRFQNESNSVLLSNMIKNLEEELTFTSGVRPSESANDVSGIDTINSSSNLHRVTKCSSSSTELSLSGTPPNLDQRNHVLRHQSTCTSEVIMEHPFSFNKVAYSQSNAEVKENDYSVLASHVYSGESSVQVSYFDMMHSVLQECTIHDLKPVQSDQICENVDYGENGTCTANSIQCAQNLKEYKLLPTLNQTSSSLFASNDDMFRMSDVNQKTYWINASLTDVVDNGSLPAETDAPPILDSLNEQISYPGLFSIDNSNQLLDAVISKINPGIKQKSESNASCKSAFTDTYSPNYARTPNHGEVDLAKPMKDEFVDFAPLVVKTEPSCISYGRSSCSSEKNGENNHESGLHKSQISPWVESCHSAKNDCASDSTSKRVSEIGKLNRKRSRPGESPRPRPKDRQMIQDRIKELREIIPNGAKCSIDSLLEKTIKHMLFLQSVTKHAEKLKVAGEPKISTDQRGLLLKDNFKGGATWAFEVGTQPITCPIVVEDLNPPRQLLVEMLCEERGSFLEIAEFIRGLGLTILKGVMETHKNHVWARFAVEANRDVTRMEIFLTLMQQLEPSAGSSMGLPNAGNIYMPHTAFRPTSVPERVV
ncbi:transcription factor LHW-like [Curcuma longa]|uniref:transcription factor LHW-like n=1 Tax=Curcuma longa TaxID=136217 RepID=UPI003D9F96D3